MEAILSLSLRKPDTRAAPSPPPPSLECGGACGHVRGAEPTSTRNLTHGPRQPLGAPRGWASLGWASLGAGARWRGSDGRADACNRHEWSEHVSVRHKPTACTGSHANPRTRCGCGLWVGAARWWEAARKRQEGALEGREGKAPARDAVGDEERPTSASGMMPARLRKQGETALRDWGVARTQGDEQHRRRGATRRETIGGGTPRRSVAVPRGGEVTPHSRKNMAFPVSRSPPTRPTTSLFPGPSTLSQGTLGHSAVPKPHGRLTRREAQSSGGRGISSQGRRRGARSQGPRDEGRGRRRHGARQSLLQSEACRAPGCEGLVLAWVGGREGGLPLLRGGVSLERGRGTAGGVAERQHDREGGAEQQQDLGEAWLVRAHGLDLGRSGKLFADERVAVGAAAAGTRRSAR